MGARDEYLKLYSSRVCSTKGTRHERGRKESEGKIEQRKWKFIHRTREEGSMNLRGIAFAVAILAVYLSAQVGFAAEKVKVAFPARSLSYFPIIVGSKMGLFQEQGLEPEFIQLRTDLSVAGLISGQVGYATPFSSVVRAAVQGVEVRAIMGLVDTAQHVLVVNPKVTSVQDLKGKKIGINEIGGAQNFEADAVLRRYGVDPASVTKVGLVGEADRLAALQAGAIDANIASAPFHVKAEQLGFKSLVILGDFLKYTHAGVGTSLKKLQTDRPQVIRFLKGSLKSLRFARAQRDETLKVMKEWLALDDDTAVKAYDIGLRTWSKDGMITESALEFDFAVLRSQGATASKLSLGNVFDGSMLKEAAAEIESNR